ncbi:hypothetical protein [Mariniluteicoccus flavus]
MTTWDDLSDDDDLVVDALSRPPREDQPRSGVPEDQTVSVQELLAAGSSDDDDDDDGGGFSDPSGSVTVWVDEAYAVVRVRVSTRWRHASPQPLGHRLLFAAQAATLGKLYAEPPGDGVEALPDTPPHPSVPILQRTYDERLLAELEEETLQLGERLAALEARNDVRPTVVHFDEARGHSQNRQVSITLDQFRRPTTVVFDDRWLAGARTEKITESVTEAFADAYAQWREPVVEPGEYDELADEFADLRRRTLHPLLVAGGWIDPRKVLS